MNGIYIKDLRLHKINYLFLEQHFCLGNLGCGGNFLIEGDGGKRFFFLHLNKIGLRELSKRGVRRYFLFLIFERPICIKVNTYKPLWPNSADYRTVLLYLWLRNKLQMSLAMFAKWGAVGFFIIHVGARS